MPNLFLKFEIQFLVKRRYSSCEDLVTALELVYAFMVGYWMIIGFHKWKVLSTFFILIYKYIVFSLYAFSFGLCNGVLTKP